MDNKKIKGFDELNDDEHMVLDAFRKMKLEYDKARVELINYQINDLINSYEELQELRDDIRVKYFAILENIEKESFAKVDKDYEKWDNILTNEKSEWNEEVELMIGFKHYFDDTIVQLDNGTIEEKMIEEEKNIY